jgi:hypothetical protein
MSTETQPENDPETAAREMSWRREIAALTAICEIMEPLDPATRRRAFAAVLCTMSDEAASAAIWAWQPKP